MIPRTYQLEMARDALAILREHGLAYLAAEERTGKTLSAVLAGEMSNAKDVLVITKKKALDGWKETISSFQPSTNFVVTNYHQAHKVIGEYDLVILDECHNYLSAFPKIGATAAQLKVLKKDGLPNKNIYDNVRRICRNTPVLYISATPHAQGPQMLYHQFSVCTFTPWRAFDNFYRWFDKYGFKYTIDINGMKANQYDKADAEKILSEVKHLFITKTRRELGFEHEPIDKVHYVELDDTTRYWYNKLQEDELIELNDGLLVCDTASKLRVSLHAIEGGTVKVDDKPVVLANDEKLQYILKTFGDTSDLVIMYNFQAEKTKLEKAFKKAHILQATSYAEGVDLHKHEHLVIYSQDYSTARHTQRRARQCNMHRDKPITVHHILVKGAISEQVYKTVCVNKKNYVDSVFKRTKV